MIKYNKEILRKFLAIFVAFAGFYYVSSQISPEILIDAVLSSKPVFLLWSGLTLGGIYYLMGLRWKLLLEEKGVDINILQSFRNICVSNFLNIFLPARGGDIYRGYLSSGKEKDTIDLSIVVLLERVTDVIMIIILLEIAIASFFPRDGLSKYLFACFTLVITGLIGIKFLRDVKKLPIHTLNSSYVKFRNYIIENFYTENLLRLTILTSVIWLLGVLRTWFVVSALDISIGYGAIVVVTLSWALVSAIPLTPSGFGTTDAVVFVILGAYGVNPSGSAAFILMNRFILQGFPLVTGGFYYTRRNIV